jgi:hypothetical protein
MKPLLLSLALLMVLFSQPTRAAEPTTPIQATAQQVATAAQDFRMMSSDRNPPKQLAIVDGSRNVGSGRLVDAPQAEVTPAEGLPSTPIALATVLLMLCILVGRRQT